LVVELVVWAVVVVLAVEVLPPIVVVVDVVTTVEVVDDEVVVEEVVVLLLVVVVTSGDVTLVVDVLVVVLVVPVGHDSSGSRGLQMSTTWSLSVGGRAFARATTRSDRRPGTPGRRRDTSTGTSTKA